MLENLHTKSNNQSDGLIKTYNINNFIINPNISNTNPKATNIHERLLIQIKKYT